MSKGATFKGFGDWVEIFRSGTHVDAAGNKRTWSDAELDQMVANHSATDPAPLVIGHPEMDAPAYGWSAALKRAGNVLLAKFGQVHEAVDHAAQTGAYRNRSIKVLKTDAGWKLAHVGLLGAAPPAIKGLAPVYSADATGEVYEFGMTSDGYWLSQIARGMRRMREFLIAEYGQDKADRVTPAYDIEDLERKAGELLNAPVPDAAPNNGPAFSSGAPSATETNVDKQFTQADLDAAIAAERATAETKSKAAAAEAAQLRFAARLADNRAFVQGLVTDDKGEVRLTPAQAEGLPECLTFLQGLNDDASTFTFTAADKAEHKPSAYQFVKDKLAALAPQMRLGAEQASTDPAETSGDAHRFAMPSGYTADPVKVALDRKVRQYMATHKTDYVTAVFAVEAAG